MVMDYMNVYRNGGGGRVPHHQAAFFMPQYPSQVSQPQQQHQMQPPRPPQQPPQQQQQGYAFQYTNEQLLVLAQMHQQRSMLNQQAAAAAAAAAGTANGVSTAGSKAADPKPRLLKDEVELLEREFQQNPKPSTSRKREIAETLKVEQPRINNWFQNRRAKEKGLKKTQDFAARKAAEEAVAPTSPDKDEPNTVSEYFGLSNQQQPVRPSSAAFPDGSGVTVREPEQRVSASEPSSSTMSSSVDDSLVICAESLAVHSEPSLSSFGGDTCLESSDDGSHVDEPEEYPSPKSLPFHHRVESAELDFTPSAPICMHTPHQPSAQNHGPDDYPGSDALTHDDIGMADFTSCSEHVSTLGMDSFDQYGVNASASSSSSPSDSHTLLAPTPSFPSQLLGRFQFNDAKTEVESPPETTEAPGMLILGRPEQPSPRSMPLSPPTPSDMRFKSPPPPANLASRRNKAGALTHLNPTALRGYQYGPKTGVDMTKRSDAASPMRRIASATGPGGVAAGIRKASLAGPVPRSPLYLERTKDVLMRSLQQTVRSPVLGSINTALSPAAPNDAFLAMSASSAAHGHGHGHHLQQASREATASSSASDDDSHFSFNTAAPPASYFATLKTPPGTPGLNGAGGFADQLSVATAHHNGSTASLNAFEVAWNFSPADEPLVTPGLGSFGSEEFTMAPPAPGYACAVGPGVSSQPPTPSFPQSGFGPSSYGGLGAGHYPWGFGPGGAANTEYNFPDSYVPDASARSSPGLPPQPKSKQFQFTQNVTPQDFNPDK